ncbi:MAG: 3-isopropylmalate dehydratase small subunit [Deltaproteobacteria bacterium]|nr:3-isopropylmalate dehydratase small subunit [Deltaproteobacteria bacterium]
MILKGRVFKFGDNIDTDAIIPARYLNDSNDENLKKHCMEDADPAFSSNVSKGDIIVAGNNFGCGSSREHAPRAIKASGVPAVIAKSFARIFYRNSFNIGLFILEADTNGMDNGDTLEVNTETGAIKNLTKNTLTNAKPIPGFMAELVSAGGLMEYARKRVNKGGLG